MELVHVDDAEPRFGDWGPGYLAQEDHVAFGALTLRPGDEFDNHYHEHHEEAFLILEGRIEIWLDRERRVDAGPGSLVRCAPGVEHYVRNVGQETARAFFIKAPGVPGDKVDAPWRPAV